MTSYKNPDGEKPLKPGENPYKNKKGEKDKKDNAISNKAFKYISIGAAIFSVAALIFGIVVFVKS